MCGIVGFTHRHWIPGAERIRSALALLAHRGPDKQAAFESRSVSLGATRLKVIDLTAGDQPMIHADGDTVIAFNGEVYNHAELRRELEGRGHRFQSHTDTETVLAAFVEWDIDCLSKLRGMFAVAFWTESQKRLVLARDRLGIKPLYTARQGRDIFFASELKGIFIHPEIERRLNMSALDCYLSLNYVPAPRTLVEGIDKLPPGHWMEWRDGDVRSRAYWSLPSGPAIKRPMAAAEEELDVLLRQSVKEHLATDVPWGVWLSGGLDSSTILHYASAAATNQLKTFSIAFPGQSFDEASSIGKTVAHYDTDHYELNLTSHAGLESAIEEFAYFSDEPSADAGALPVWFLSRLTKGNATVALSGDGSDELFGGYLTYRADRLASLLRPLPRSVLSFALTTANRWPVSDEKISFEYKLKRFLSGSLLSEARAHVYWNGTFSEPEKEFLLGGVSSSELTNLLNSPQLHNGGLPAQLWFDQKYFLPDDILTKVDRMSMAHSVEVRPPFLDHRIVEFAASLPPEMKMKGRQQKIILKKLMGKRLPPHILGQKKIGFDIPAHEWLRGALRPLLLETIEWAKVELRDLFQSSELDRLVRQHLERRANLGYHLWGLMILFLWMKRWRIQAGAALSLSQHEANEVPVPI